MSSSAEPAGTERHSRRSAAKHTAILRAALEVFLESGYAGASVDSVAATAGVGKQTVYAHFGDKEKLFLAAVQQSSGLLGDDADPWQSPIVSSENVRADLVSVGVRILRVVLAPEAAALHRLTIAEIPRHPELQRLWRDNVPQEALADLVGYFAEQDRAGRLAVPDPELTSRQFVLLLATEGRVRTLHGAQPLPEHMYEEIAGDTADLFVRALHPCGSP